MPPKAGGGKTAFVTVGTTKFDALIRAVDDMRVVDALRQRGFRRLNIQLGSGFYLPTVLCTRSSTHAVLPDGFTVRSASAHLDASRAGGRAQGQAPLQCCERLGCRVCTSYDTALVGGWAEECCVQVDWFDFAPSLQQLMQEADLIISHAGSGSLFEALHLRKVGCPTCERAWQMPCLPGAGHLFTSCSACLSATHVWTLKCAGA